MNFIWKGLKLLDKCISFFVHNFESICLKIQNFLKKVLTIFKFLNNSLFFLICISLKISALLFTLQKLKAKCCTKFPIIVGHWLTLQQLCFGAQKISQSCIHWLILNQISVFQPIFIGSQFVFFAEGNDFCFLGRGECGGKEKRVREGKSKSAVEKNRGIYWEMWCRKWFRQFDKVSCKGVY